VSRIGAKSIQGTFPGLFYDFITLLIKENIMKKRPSSSGETVERFKAGHMKL
jgi:hypothetical protein